MTELAALHALVSNQRTFPRGRHSGFSDFNTWSLLARDASGEAYVGTAPSYGIQASGFEVLPTLDVTTGPSDPKYRAGTFRASGEAPTTQIVCATTGVYDTGESYVPLSTEIGLNVWGGNCIFVIPAPEPVEHLPALPKLFSSQLRALSGRFVEHGTERDKAHRDPHAELRSLAEDTRLPIEQLAELLASSRRTVYNWLAGRPIGSDSQARVLRVRDALAPIVASRDPVLVGEWLRRGHPSPLALASAEEWPELAERVRADTSPLQALPQQTAPEEGGEPQADSAATIRAALLSFAAAPLRSPERRDSWGPREVTGIASGAEEDPE